MPTAVSSTDAAARRTQRRRIGLSGHLAEARTSVIDVGHLLRFRRQASRRRRSSRLLAVILGTVVGLTASALFVPASLPDAGGEGRAFDVLLVLPAVLAGFLALTVVSAAAAGGGRELVARDPAAVLPISPTTDHLGGLLLAPLNVAWIVQSWALVAATSFAVGWDNLVRAEIIVVLWIFLATAFGQVVSWTLEGIRRLNHGIAFLRVAALVLVAGVLVLQTTGVLAVILDRLPTTRLVAAMLQGWSLTWFLCVAGLILGALVCIVLGAIPAHWAANHIPRDELRVETGNATPRPMARTMLGALIRTDRVSVWRAVPMRRGLVVLALGPGLVAVLGDLDWETMTILPGLVASGGALLYGVNAWCLDGRGILWRESLPVPPSAVFDSRAYVLAEFLTVGSLATVLLGFVRAGVPGVGEFAALIGAVLVVTVQVVAAAMRWSLARPFAVDMRSARATPAPPAVMVGYSARLAVSTTFVGVFFSLLSRLEDPSVTIVVALVMIAWSGGRLLLTRRDWIDPHRRVRVTTTVVGA